MHPPGPRIRIINRPAAMKTLLFPAALILLILGAIAAMWFIKHESASASPAAESSASGDSTRRSHHFVTKPHIEEPPIAPQFSGLAAGLKRAPSKSAPAP